MIQREEAWKSMRWRGKMEEKHEENAWKRDNRKKWSVEMWSVGWHEGACDIISGFPDDSLSMDKRLRQALWKVAFGTIKGYTLHCKRIPFITHWNTNNYNNKNLLGDKHPKYSCPSPSNIFLQNSGKWDFGKSWHSKSDLPTSGKPLLFFQSVWFMKQVWHAFRKQAPYHIAVLRMRGQMPLASTRMRITPLAACPPTEERWTEGAVILMEERRRPSREKTATVPPTAFSPTWTVRVARS